MSIETTVFTLPQGTRCLRLVSAGRTEPSDAENLLRQMAPGKPLADLPMLVITDESTSVSAEARGIFTRGLGDASPSGPERWVAIVTQSVLLRVTLNFINRVNKTSRMKMFSTEDEAARWLESVCSTDTAAPQS